MADRPGRATLLRLLPLLLTLALAILVALPHGLALPARLSLFAFGTATILWTTSALPTAYVAVGAVIFLVLTGAVPQKTLFGMLDADVIWLLAGTFVISAAFEETGLAARMSAAIGRGSTTIGGLCWRLTLGIVPLSFVIPSTSGRAALLLPLFRGLADATGDRRVSRALALLIPGVILIATVGSLVGAGSHLIADDLLQRIAGKRIGFGLWIVYGLPFAIAASLVFCWIVTRMFLDPELRRQKLVFEQKVPQALSAAEWRTVAVATIMIGLWVTEGMHPLGIALVAMLGSFVLCTPRIGVLEWKQGMEAVSWNLILFVGAALALGQALIGTGAADWVIHRLLSATGLGSAHSTLAAFGALLLVSLTSHLYFTSHTARAAALLPPLLLLGKSLDLDLVALMFIATVGMDYSLTFPVSSKALLLFEEGADETWEPSDLFKLSLVMLPIYAALMAAFYYGFWRPIGLAL